MPKYVVSKDCTYSMTIEAENISEARKKADNTDLRQGSENWHDTSVLYAWDKPCEHPQTKRFDKLQDMCLICDTLLMRVKIDAG